MLHTLQCLTRCISLGVDFSFGFRQVSWEEESPWRSLQAITSSLLLYWVTCVVLVRVVNDWRFRRRLHWWATQGYTEAEFRCTIPPCSALPSLPCCLG